MSYEYEGTHNYQAPHNPKTHNGGEPCVVVKYLSTYYCTVTVTPRRGRGQCFVISSTFSLADGWT